MRVFVLIFWATLFIANVVSFFVGDIKIVSALAAIISLCSFLYFTRNDLV